MWALGMEKPWMGQSSHVDFCDIADSALHVSLLFQAVQDFSLEGQELLVKDWVAVESLRIWPSTQGQSFDHEPLKTVFGNMYSCCIVQHGFNRVLTCWNRVATWFIWMFSSLWHVIAESWPPIATKEALDLTSEDISAGRWEARSFHWRCWKQENIGTNHDTKQLRKLQRCQKDQHIYAHLYILTMKGLCVADWDSAAQTGCICSSECYLCHNVDFQPLGIPDIGWVGVDGVVWAPQIISLSPRQLDCLRDRQGREDKHFDVPNTTDFGVFEAKKWRGQVSQVQNFTDLSWPICICPQLFANGGASVGPSGWTTSASVRKLIILGIDQLCSWVKLSYTVWVSQELTSTITGDLYDRGPPLLSDWPGCSPQILSNNPSTWFAADLSPSIQHWGETAINTIDNGFEDDFQVMFFCFNMFQPSPLVIPPVFIEASLQQTGPRPMPLLHSAGSSEVAAMGAAFSVNEAQGKTPAMKTSGSIFFCRLEIHKGWCFVSPYLVDCE